MRCDVNISVRARRDEVRRQDRNQKSQFFSASSKRRSSSRSSGRSRSSNRAARCSRRRHLWIRCAKRPPDALQGVRQRLSLLPRAGFAAAARPPDLVEKVKPKCRSFPTRAAPATSASSDLTPYEAGVIIDEREVADYLRGRTLPGLKNRKAAANWVMTEVLRVVHESDKPSARRFRRRKKSARFSKMIEEARSASMPRRRRSLRCAPRARARRRR